MKLLLLLTILTSCTTINKINDCKIREREKETSKLDGGK
jgi:hypothetical protein